MVTRLKQRKFIHRIKLTAGENEMFMRARDIDAPLLTLAEYITGEVKAHVLETLAQPTEQDKLKAWGEPKQETEQEDD